MKNTIINLGDSYKYSHFEQYPKGTTITHSYLESRGGEYDEVVFVGLQYLLKEYLSKPITQEDIDQAEKMVTAHGLPFAKEGWQRILDVHGGYMPVVIRAVPEGMVLAPKNVLLTVENTDPELPWVASFLETLLLKVWYPTTVASKSRHVKKIIQKYYDKTMDDHSGISFAYHNFGSRGSTTEEAAALAGFAHLTQFMGTDNFNALNLCKEYYGEDVAGFSIPATEHSTVTSWTKDGEYQMMENYLENSKGQALIACVMDSYNIFKAVDFVTSGKMKEKIESDDYPTFVIRPDSGDPVKIVAELLRILEKNQVAYTVNSKGYKLFNKYRLIWGDGVNPESIDKILTSVVEQGYAAGNINFGSGGDLCQNINRDTCKFAIKCSMAVVNGEERDVFKDPITDKGKKSKKGRLTLVRWRSNACHDKRTSDFQTIRLTDFDPKLHVDMMGEVYRDGKLMNATTMFDIRKISK